MSRLPRLGMMRMCIRAFIDGPADLSPGIDPVHVLGRRACAPPPWTGFDWAAFGGARTMEHPLTWGVSAGLGCSSK
jgi:hypothetical protein